MWMEITDAVYILFGLVYDANSNGGKGRLYAAVLESQPNPGRKYFSISVLLCNIIVPPPKEFQRFS